MKKLLTGIFSIMMLLSLAVMSSCGGAPTSAEIEKIVDKYDDDMPLTADDYNDLISYIDAALDEVGSLYAKWEKAEELGQYRKIEEYEAQEDALKEKYEYYSKALRIIKRADDDDLGSAKANARKLLKKERRFEEKY